MRALLLLYYFPPSGGPGVQRGIKLCRQLPRLGIDATVVTVEEATYRQPGEYAPDPTLAPEVPAQLRVVRTPSGRRLRTESLLTATRAFQVAQQSLPRLFFERQAGWFAPALEAGLREIERARPGVLLTSSQPYVVHLVGRELRRRTGIPWVADFRDPWTTAWGRTWPSHGAYAWECEREDEVLADADLVIANTPGSRRDMLARRPWLAPAKVVVVPNGYDPEDFAVAPAPRDPSDYLVVHSGAFRAPPPGRRRSGVRAWLDRRRFAPLPYDLTTHTPETLLRALSLLRGAGATRRVRVRLVGPLDPAWLGVARDLGVADDVEHLGYRPHREATAHVLAADLLYLPTVTRTDGVPVSNVPAKTYEYLGSGRPLAALAGPGDVQDLIGGRERVTLLDPRDSEGLAGLVLRGVRGESAPDCPVDPDDAHRWRRDALAERMGACLEAAAVGVAPVSPPKGR